MRWTRILRREPFPPVSKEEMAPFRTKNRIVGLTIAALVIGTCK